MGQKHNKTRTHNCFGSPSSSSSSPLSPPTCFPFPFLVYCICSLSSYLYPILFFFSIFSSTFAPSHLHTFTPSHLHTFTPSHLHTALLLGKLGQEPELRKSSFKLLVRMAFDMAFEGQIRQQREAQAEQRRSSSKSSSRNNNADANRAGFTPHTNTQRSRLQLAVAPAINTAVDSPGFSPVALAGGPPAVPLVVSQITDRVALLDALA